MIGGAKLCLDYLEKNANRYQFQIVKHLPILGAYHTELMKPVEKQIASVLNQIQLNVPRINVYSNYTGKIYMRRNKKIFEHIIYQVSNPVKWEQIVQLLYRKHQVFFLINNLI